MPVNDRTDERGISNSANQRSIALLFTEGHLKLSFDDKDEVFSFREDATSRKRIPTPDFANDYTDNILESPVHQKPKTIDAEQRNEKRQANYVKLEKKSNLDDKFFKFRKLMMQDNESPDNTVCSLSNSPEIRRKASLPLSVGLNRNIGHELQFELLKSNKLASLNIKNIKRFSTPCESKLQNCSPQKQISQAFNIFNQQMQLAVKNNCNLLDFVFNSKSEVRSLNIKSSIEDDIVSTPTRQKELNCKLSSKSHEFKIALHPAESDFEKLTETRLVSLRHSCDLRINDLNSRRGNLIEFNSERSISQNYDDEDSLESPLFNPQPRPNKRNRIIAQYAFIHLKKISDSRVKSYFSIIVNNRLEDRDQGNSHTEAFLLRSKGILNQRDRHTVKIKQFYNERGMACNNVES